MEHFYIIANNHKDSNFEKTNYIKKYLEAHNKKCSIGMEIIPEDADCVLVLGGDGTLLQAARDMIDRDTPLLGINLGTLGYLAEIEESGLEAALEQLLKGEYEIEQRMMLSGKVIRNEFHENLHREKGILDYDKQESYALNDIVITRSGTLQIIKFHLYVNGQFLNRYNADGVIVSTPTGSTGYNMSAGGPIVEPKAELLLVTPICPHTLNTRSIVLAPGDKIEIEIVSGREDSIQQVEVNFDGSHKLTLYTGDRVEIKRAVKTTGIVKMSKVSFLEVLHKKMSD
ncbi:MAG: NAD(+)/NADH kinase [Clostridiales bacterium]|nr:NAD(+)/NADH kinase [Clostridiales bacterium]